MDTLEEVQNQIKVLNNEIKETLVDIREYLLTYAQNPFASDARQHQGAPPPAPAPAQYAIAPPPGSPPVASPDVKGAAAAPPVTNGPTSGPPAAAPASPAFSPQPPAPAMAAGQGQAMSSVLEAAVLHDLLSSRTGRSQEAAPVSPPAADKKDGATTPRSEEDETPRPKSQPRNAQKGPGPSAVPSKNESRKGYLIPMGRRSDEDVPDTDASDERESASAEEGEPTAPARKTAPVDMITIAMLAPWVEDGIQRIGRNRLKGVVKTYAATGNLSPEHKDVIFQLINLDSNEAAPAVVSLKDSLAVLADLDNLMVRSRLDRTGTAMLAVYLKGNSGGVR